ncbi:jg2800, partial [Pararge aegeria aegeria]
MYSCADIAVPYRNSKTVEIPTQVESNDRELAIPLDPDRARAMPRANAERKIFSRTNSVIKWKMFSLYWRMAAITRGRASRGLQRLREPR